MPPEGVSPRSADFVDRAPPGPVRSVWPGAPSPLRNARKIERRFHFSLECNASAEAFRGGRMSDRIPMTRAGYEKLEAELKQIRSVERPKIVKEIELARAHGDLSENAEFHAAKERQSHIEGRVRLIDDRLARAQVIDPSGQALDQVRFGMTVVLVDTDTNDEVTYTILGEEEADAKFGRISVTSPVARALLGRGIGDTVSVRVPKGMREFEILEIRVDPIACSDD